MAFVNLATELSNYTDELSLELIAKAVLNTNLMEEIDVRSGLSAGVVAINLMDGTLNPASLDCGWPTEDEANITFSQVDIAIKDLQVKQRLCPEDLRQYWLSQKMSAGAQLEEVPFSEVIADYYVKKIKEYNEGYIINGFDATYTGVKAQVTAGSTNIPAGAAAWVVSNALDQALDLYDAIDESVKDRDDLIMLVSPANYRTLTRALVAQGDTGFFHYNYGDGQGVIMLPGTNCKVVKTSGLTSSNFVAAGPAGFIVAGTGLTDDMSSINFFYDRSEDTVKFMAKWRLGVAVSQPNVFSHNNLA